MARGKPDPYEIVGGVNDRAAAAEEDYVWALKDIDFSVEQGQVVGIIGKNGAGKSTLLKLLSQVTNPSTGNIKVKGRIASLLEVGTGFHPELTGRENIFLNGAILGMTKREIRAQLEEIVDFAGVAKYIDTPVKRYSSGMKVRLGFAVAAHLEPEILVVDEVLAVGDAEFQKKAIGKMQDVSKSAGRTVLFVSHNMASVRNLCTRGVLLEDGYVSFQGDVDQTIDKYLGKDIDCLDSSLEFEDLDLPFQFTSIRMTKTNEYIEEIIIDMELLIKESANDYTVGFIVYDIKGNCLMVSTFDDNGELLISVNDQGRVKLKASIPGYILKPGIYSITFSAKTLKGPPIHKIEDKASFQIEDTHTFRGHSGMYRSLAVVAPAINWIKI